MSFLDVRDLAVSYPVAGARFWARKQFVQAVRGVSFSVAPGETLGIVGESGCGKSSLARTLVLLQSPTAGGVRFKGEDISKLNGGGKKAYRRSVQMIFQDPYGSLNPKLSVGASIAEGMVVHRLHDDGESQRQAVVALLQRVGLDSSAARRFPHEFSGGQRQRIGIARALAVQPELIVCDEPVSALDVSVQAQVVNLLRDLQRSEGLAYVFISHDLAVVKHLSHRLLVMYLGQVVEEGDASEVVSRPRHPYTQALVKAIPGTHPGTASEKVLDGDLPSPIDPPGGCAFHTRCPVAEARCRTEMPGLREVGPDVRVACHRVTPDGETPAGS